MNVHGVEQYGTTVSDVENPATNCSDIRPKEKTGSLARNRYRDGLMWSTRVPSLKAGCQQPGCKLYDDTSLEGAGRGTTCGGLSEM